MIAAFLISVALAWFVWWAITRRHAAMDRTVAELQTVEGTVVGLTVSTEGQAAVVAVMSGRLVSVTRTAIVIEPFEPIPSGIVGPAPRYGGTMQVPFRLISTIETVRGRIMLREN
jgi:hypothetical protein